jgi:purine-binding chemotaxis protein CheW
MSMLHIICRIADSEYAIPAAEISQMESFSGATPVPGAPTYVAGLAHLRQQVIPVVDLRARFGLPAVAPTLDSRIVVVQVGTRRVGLLVDSAREVQNIAPEQQQDAPDLLLKQSTGFVRSVAQVDNRIIMLLDASRVIGEELAHVEN